MERPTIYLAGPEVFLPEARVLAGRKQALCEAYGFAGLFPLDDEATTAPTIYRGNLALLRRADLLIANLTPFRGPSADCGTVFELGVMIGLGRPVLGYTNDGSDLLARVRSLDPGVRLDPHLGAFLDGSGARIEDFGLFDNLMIDAALAEGGFPVIRRAVAVERRLTDLDGFAACLALARDRALPSEG